MHFSPRAAQNFDDGQANLNAAAYLALAFRKALNLLVQRVDLVLLLFVFFDFAGVHLLNLPDSLSLLG